MIVLIKNSVILQTVHGKCKSSFIKAFKHSILLNGLKSLCSRGKHFFCLKYECSVLSKKSLNPDLRFAVDTSEPTDRAGPSRRADPEQWNQGRFIQGEQRAVIACVNSSVDYTGTGRANETLRG